MIVDLTGHDQLLAVVGEERHPARRATEYDGIDAGGRILEREPDVTAAQRDATDLALDQDVLQAGREQVVDPGIELEDGQRPDRGLRLDRHQGSASANRESGR